MTVLALAGWQSSLELGEVAGLREVTKTLDGDMWTGEDNFREAAEAEGLAMGLAKGRSDVLLNLVRHKCGEAFASEVAPALGISQSVQTLDELGVFLLTCDSSESLLAKLHAL